MRSSQDNNEEKPKVRQSRKVKASPKSEARNSQGQPEDKERKLPTPNDEPTSQPMSLAMTEDEFRCRISKKAYALYEKRRALTDVEDWLEAERLVKQQLLAEGQWAGTV